MGASFWTKRANEFDPSWPKVGPRAGCTTRLSGSGVRPGAPFASRDPIRRSSAEIGERHPKPAPARASGRDGPDPSPEPPSREPRADLRANSAALSGRLAGGSEDERLRDITRQSHSRLQSVWGVGSASRPAKLGQGWPSWGPTLANVGPSGPDAAKVCQNVRPAFIDFWSKPSQTWPRLAEVGQPARRKLPANFHGE